MNTLPRFLTTVIENGVVIEESSSSGDFLFAAICLVIGAFCIIFPHAAWYLRQGWKFKDAQPSELALVLTRIAGVIAVIIGFIFFII